MHPQRDILDLPEGGARLRVEIDRHDVGLARAPGLRKPRVLRDRRQLRHVEQRLQAAADEHRRHIGARHGFHAHAARVNVRRTMLIERLALYAVGKALHHQRTIRRPRAESAARCARNSECRSPLVNFGSGQNTFCRLVTSSQSPSGSVSRPSRLRCLEIVELRGHRVRRSRPGRRRASARRGVVTLRSWPWCLLVAFAAFGALRWPSVPAVPSTPSGVSPLLPFCHPSIPDTPDGAVDHRQ